MVSTRVIVDTIKSKKMTKRIFFMTKKLNLYPINFRSFKVQNSLHPVFHLMESLYFMRMGFTKSSSI